MQINIMLILLPVNKMRIIYVKLVVAKLFLETDPILTHL